MLFTVFCYIITDITNLWYFVDTFCADNDLLVILVKEFRNLIMEWKKEIFVKKYISY
jgi:hypothetical protein